MENNIIGEASFRFSSRFSQLIGRNLISNPVVAVSELVKNSYDADADNICVEFRGLKSEQSSLIISDDGIGMSYEDVVTKWMVVGTDNKIHSPFTKKGRRKLGEKGIGRFSVERLAHKVEIISKQKGEDFAITFSIDWDKYENSEEDFSDHVHQIRKIPAEVDEQGTCITLIGLRDVWKEDNLLDLQKELEILRPIDINSVSFKKYDFPGSEVKIRLIAKEFIKGKKLIKSNFISFAQAHLYGEIHKDGTATIQVDIKSNISMSRENVSALYTYENGEIDSCCGPITYEIFIFLKDKRLYRSLTVEKKDMDDYLKAFCGVKIYRDGFRILPFGDPDNDWLELNAKRTSSPEHRMGTQNTIGIVSISRDSNPGLQDVLNRENMYDTQEFSALKSFVNLAFEKYTEIQLSARKKKDRKTTEEGQKALSNAKKAVSAFSKQIDSFKKATDSSSNSETPNVSAIQIGKEILKVLNTAETSLAELKSAYGFYKKQTDFKSREMQIYRNIATLGISAAIFGHEALNQTVESKAIVNDVIADYTDVIRSAEGLEEQILDLQKNLILIDEKADFYRNYLTKEKQDSSQYINLVNILNQILAQHKSAFAAINVAPQVKFDGKIEDYVSWAYEGDIGSVFTNLITNAYKALKKSADPKILEFTLKCDDSTYVIHALNTGKPIEPEDRSKIFEPMFSTYSDGTGLGLTIVQDTLQSYNGSIELANEYPQTHFIIKIPHSDAPEEDE